MGFSLVPFVLSIGAAYVSWEIITGLATVWRMVVMTLIWIAAFAAGTQLFWKVVERLTPK